jgi:hypothetical protein
LRVGEEIAEGFKGEIGEIDGAVAVGGLTRKSHREGGGKPNPVA